MIMTTLSKSNWDETNIMQINFTLNRLYMSDYDSENQTTFNTYLKLIIWVKPNFILYLSEKETNVCVLDSDPQTNKKKKNACLKRL